MKTQGALITVREHAWLGTEPVKAGLDAAQVPASAFDHLCALSESFSRTGAKLLQVEGRRRLKLDNHVGVIRTPCGTTIEILPKHTSGEGSTQDARRLLRRLLLSSLSVTPREAGSADLQRFDAPLTEWVMNRFLQELEALLSRGLRFDYVRTEDVQRFLRGQLNVVAQLRQPPGREHLFHLRHDLYLPDRPENRLLRSALHRVLHSTTLPQTWRLANELTERLNEVRRSTDVHRDFQRWGKDRLLAHYQAIRPWCQLVLGEEMPLALAGQTHGLSLLFPMEKLFERHVVQWLRRCWMNRGRVRAPAASQSLCSHEDRPIFQLQPDILVEADSERWVLDTKWKLLDAGNRSDKYGLSQADFYQLYAYGQKYLGGKGRMALIYPRTEGFLLPLSPFRFDDLLTLEVLPFNLSEDHLIGAGRLGPLWSACEGCGDPDSDPSELFETA